MSTKMILRHSRKAIFLHWFNAACWFFLLATGLGLIENPDLQPLGMWWPKIMRTIFGGAGNLLVAHEVCGFLWAAVFLLFGILFARTETIPFVKQVFSFSVKDDLQWLVKKMVLMTAGPGVLKKIGLGPELPDQGFYNMGQKMFAVPALLGGIVTGATGVIMALSKTMDQTGLVQWSMLAHFVAVGLVFAGLLVHIFMASLAKGEEPVLRSMFTGTVPEEFVKHHNRLWYESLVKERSDSKRKRPASKAKASKPKKGSRSGRNSN